MAALADDTNEDIEALKTAILNEKGSPEILQYQEDLVDDLKELVDNQQLEVDASRGRDSEQYFYASLYQMEIERVKWMLQSYLEIRLQKIQQCPFHITMSAEYYDRLSPHEFKFARGYVDLLSKHFDTVLTQLPETLRSLTKEEKEGDMVKTPPLNTYVFCRINEDLGEVEVNADDGTSQEDQTVELRQGDVYALRYGSVKELVEAGKLDLI